MRWVPRLLVMGVDDNQDNSRDDSRDAEEKRAQEEFLAKLSAKYDGVFDDPIPARLADLIARLREIKPT
ncbi:MAG: hypothetical protein AAFX32_01645 [Pseudomonadota bacterium]